MTQEVQFFQARNLTYIVIDNFYSPEELIAFDVEIKELLTKAEPPEKTDTAYDELVGLKKKAMGVWLDGEYKDRSQSALLTANRKLFDPQLADALSVHNVFFKHLSNSNKDGTLLNFYANGDFYTPHIDYSIFTAITMFSIGTFEGGGFAFPEHNVQIPFKENRVLIFPGCVTHEAKAITAEPGNYRVTMAQFLNYG